MTKVLRYIVGYLAFGVLFAATFILAGQPQMRWWQMALLIIGTLLAANVSDKIKGK